MDSSPYNPKPLDTSQVQLAEGLERLTALLAENAHDAWAFKSFNQGWTFGATRNDQRKRHPRLLPFKNLPAVKRNSYRNAALDMIKALLALGYSIECPEGEAITQAADFAEKGKKVIARIKSSSLSVALLRKLWEERVPIVWSSNVEVYRRAVDVALKLGESFMAFDIAAAGLQTFKNDLRLVQLQALALARTGATRRANAILDQLRLSGHQDEETLGILARTHKDFWLLSADPDEKREHLKTSFELYAEAYQRNRGYYSGINAASMALLYHETITAKKLAREVADHCQAALAKIAPESDERYWLEATLAEAALILGDLPRAEEYYRRGSEFSGQSSVVISRTRSQARLLLEALCGNPSQLDHCFILPRIVVFSGHMFDRAGRKQPRFPQALESAIREEIRADLAEQRAQVGYSSLACGADMIFAECLLERGGEVNIVLPFKKEDFKESSVEIMPGPELGERFERILENAATVTILNERGDAKDGAAYDYCNQALSGLALLKSRFLGMDVVPMVVWDGLRGDGRGGTQSFVDFWQNRRETQVKIVSLSEHLTKLAPPPAAKPAAKAHTHPAPAPVEVPAESQEIKAMIFADIVGYTKLSEIQIPLFVKHFLGKVAELMDSMKNSPIHQNTWGDAVCCVFDQVSDAGVFALNLRDLVCHTDWSQCGLPNDLNIRIALHAGPVFPCYDPILKKRTFNGSHVNRTARIEPIAEEGQIYASEAFAALATADGVAEFTCDYVGTKQLAKQYGVIPVFLVRRSITQ